MASGQRDVIRINDLSLGVSLANASSWSSDSAKPKARPVLVTLSLLYDLRRAGNSDDLSQSISYSSIYSALTRASTSDYASLEALLDHIFAVAFDTYPSVEEVDVKIVLPKFPLHCKAAGIEAGRSRNGVRTHPNRFILEDLICHGIIGVNPHERVQKQTICLNISYSSPEVSPIRFDFGDLARRIYTHVTHCSFLTLEALASSIARVSLCDFENASDTVTIRAAKPEVLAFAQSAEVEISRNLTDYYSDPAIKSSKIKDTGTLCSDKLTNTVPQPVAGSAVPPLHRPLLSLLSVQPQDRANGSLPMHTVAIAIGTNLGDRFANIERALRFLEDPYRLFPLHKDAVVSIIDTSFMYETAPMYVTDQPMFINCACLVETDLAHRTLLDLLKTIEETVGRTPSIRNGPRLIDLDILTYDSEIFDSRDEGNRGNLDNLGGELVIPHPRMAEREFVLRPLDDMIPDFIHPVLNKPIHALLEDVARSRTGDASMRKVIPFPRYPLSVPPPPDQTHFVPATSNYWKYPSSSTESLPSKASKQKTYLMATLNATPDSFSDGSMHNSLPGAISYATASVAAGADIIDIGGYSTRPGATYVSPEEEISRVVPIIEALRDIQQLNPKLRDVLISVDTFRADVAKAAVLAGANCINDVYAFTGPEYPLTEASAKHFLSMREVARDLAVPVVLMHSRGDAGANKDYSAYGECDGAVLEGIRVELGDKVDAIVKGRGGVRRWLVIVDPGVGFSKDMEANLEVLRHARSITAESRLGEVGGVRRNPLAGYPQLIGPSRKSFLGTILGQADEDGGYEGRETAPKERGWGTAAAVTCAVQQGALAVRVHDVLDMGDVVRVASALWGRR